MWKNPSLIHKTMHNKPVIMHKLGVDGSYKKRLRSWAKLNGASQNSLSTCKKLGESADKANGSTVHKSTAPTTSTTYFIYTNY